MVVVPIFQKNLYVAISSRFVGKGGKANHRKIQRTLGHGKLVRGVKEAGDEGVMEEKFI